jgi:hypothetical protein
VERDKVDIRGKKKQKNRIEERIVKAVVNDNGDDEDGRTDRGWR